MHKFFKIVGSIIGFLILFFILIFLPQSPFCHSLQKNIFVSIGFPIFSTDSSHIVFYRNVEVTRPPVYVCRFPDGGSSLPVEKYLQIYTTSAENMENPKLIATLSFPSKQFVAETELKVWEGDKIILRSDNGREMQFFQINSHNGQISQLPANTYQEIQEKYWGQFRFSPINQTKWLDYDSRFNLIGIFTGNYWTLDSTRKSVSFSGDRDSQPNPYKIIVDTNQLEQLLPKAIFRPK